VFILFSQNDINDKHQFFYLHILKANLDDSLRPKGIKRYIDRNELYNHRTKCLHEGLFHPNCSIFSFIYCLNLHSKNLIYAFTSFSEKKHAPKLCVQFRNMNAKL
jgi:hypothetical protein